MERNRHQPINAHMWFDGRNPAKQGCSRLERPSDSTRSPLPALPPTKALYKHHKLFPLPVLQPTIPSLHYRFSSHSRSCLAVHCNRCTIITYWRIKPSQALWCRTTSVTIPQPYTASTILKRLGIPRLSINTRTRRSSISNCRAASTMASGGVTPALSIKEPQETSETTTGLSKLNPEFGLSESSANALKGASNNTNVPVKICVFCGASPGTSPAHMVSPIYPFL